jgi:magnesium-transporting ATPase (P-type)
LPKARPPHPLRLLASQVTHTLALLLWAAAGLAFAAGLPQIGWAVIAIILINGVFSFWQEYRASQLVQALHRRLPAGSRVYRDGMAHRTSVHEIVQGDVIILHRGDRVPADVRLLRATSLLADYSILTGESEPVSRTADGSEPVPLVDARNCLLAGTTVVEGSADGVVFATGASTSFGRVATLAERLYLEPSPLQRELGVTARVIAAVAVGIAITFFAVGGLTQRTSLEDSFIFGLGILVAIIPEGLLPTVTLALAAGVQRMAGRNAIVKRLSSVETLGATSVICTDKTGTLTISEMTVREIWVGDAHYSASGQGYSLKGAIRRARGSAAEDRPGVELLLRCAVLCNNGIVPQPHRHRSGLGDPLDEALLVLAHKGSLDADEERRRMPRVFEFPFDASRRCMSTVHDAKGDLVLFVKGSPAEVLALSTMERRNGEPSLLDERRRIALLERINAMTALGQRVLALAYRDLDVGNPPSEARVAEQQLTLLGLVGVDNPLRPEVPTAVQQCHTAGIQVVMLTGDHGHTALAVANQAGIAPSGEEAVSGGDIDRLPDEELDSLLVKHEPRVFARVTPEQKLRLVEAYQRLGRVVAVTGDGVNDAPALKAADIGVAMGKRGTDIAREAADMILLDDNFATIVKAVEEGRGIYTNIRKFLTYFLTSNVAEAAPFVLFVLAGVPLPLTVLQVLLVDLGTDIFPGLALGVDPVEQGAMRRPPRSLAERMVNRALFIRALGFLGVVAAILSLSGYFVAQWDFTGELFGSMVDEGPLYRQATTITLAGIVACQIANAFACRSERQSVFVLGFLTNRPLLVAIAAEVALLALLIAVPPFADVFNLEPIEPRFWPMLALFVPLFLLIEELRKLITRRLRPVPLGATRAPA